MAGTTECPHCSNEYSHIGKHWAGPKCDYPVLSDRQRKIVEGILLGDGTIGKSPERTNSRFDLEVCEFDFIGWVSDELECFSSNIYKSESDTDGCRDTYRLQTVRFPEMSEMREKWYPNGNKRFPRDISLDRMMLSMWYVTDGGLSVDKRYNSKRSYISVWNERENKEKILSYFDSTPFSPYWSGEKQIYIPADETDMFLDWIAGPVPGYEYKWTEEFK